MMFDEFSSQKNGSGRDRGPQVSHNPDSFPIGGALPVLCIVAPPTWNLGGFPPHRPSGGLDPRFHRSSCPRSQVIFADPTVLSTLSRREVVEGLAEAIKMGVIRDAQLFEVPESGIINWDRIGRGIKQCKFYGKFEGVHEKSCHCLGW